jgi:glutaredoxin
VSIDVLSITAHGGLDSLRAPAPFLDPSSPVTYHEFLMPTIEVVLYTKPGCCLCDEVKQKLQGLQKRQAFNLREVNILEDQEAYARFKDEIPVVFVNGKKAFKYHLDEDEFLKRLARGVNHGA